MICPNCRAGEISPLTHRCEFCGSVPEGMVAVEAPRAEALDEIARVELAERFRLDEFLGGGTASAVYLAREQGSARQIVVKRKADDVGGAVVVEKPAVDSMYLGVVHEDQAG